MGQMSGCWGGRTAKAELREQHDDGSFASRMSVSSTAALAKRARPARQWETRAVG